MMAVYQDEILYKDYVTWINGYPEEYYDNWIAGHAAHQFDDCGKTDCWYCIYWRPYDNQEVKGWKEPTP